MLKKKSQMDQTLWLKFTQHQDLKMELLSTGDAELVEACQFNAINLGQLQLVIINCIL
jgi:predicted NAD-dependent protein-ADP-ribosyltransferase YbiA (DUF1768 family)